MTAFTHDFTTEGSRNRVTDVDYQRNGVCGAGFYVLRFQCSSSPERPLIGVVFDYDPYEAEATSPNGFHNPRTAVIDPYDLSSHWRGDVFHAGLCAAVAAWEAADRPGSPYWHAIHVNPLDTMAESE